MGNTQKIGNIAGKGKLKLRPSLLAEKRSKKLDGLDMSALGTDFDKQLLQNADFELGSAQFDIPQMNYNDRPRQDAMRSQVTSALLRGGLSAVAVHNSRPYEDPAYPPSPVLVKKAGDKRVLSKAKIQMEDDEPGKRKEGLFDTVSPAANKDQQDAAAAPSTSHVIQALTRYITQKHKDGASIKDLMNQRKIKEHIFEIIFE